MSYNVISPILHKKEERITGLFSNPRILVEEFMV